MLREVPTLANRWLWTAQQGEEVETGKPALSTDFSPGMTDKGWSTAPRYSAEQNQHTDCSTPLTVHIKATASTYFTTVLMARNAWPRPRAEEHRGLPCCMRTFWSVYYLPYSVLFSSRLPPSLHIYSSLPQSYKSTLQTQGRSLSLTLTRETS